MILKALLGFGNSLGIFFGYITIQGLDSRVAVIGEVGPSGKVGGP